MNISNNEYWTEVDSIVENICTEALADNDNDRDDAESDIFDSRLHETIDGHQWVIYTAHNLDVIQHSDNGEYGLDEGLIGWKAGESSFSELTSALAFWALYQDVSERISDKLDELTA